MTENVKQFIEENITTIEQQNWRKLFEDWYFIYSTTDVSVDYGQLEELFEVFREAGINLAEASELDRQSFIQDLIRAYIDDMRFMEEESVSWAGTVNSLQSRLGVNLLDIKQLFRSVCEAEGLKPTTNDKIRYILK